LSILGRFRKKRQLETQNPIEVGALLPQVDVEIIVS
jgi:hypothetical protein